MYRLLIVDDEIMVREAVRHLVNWSKLNIYPIDDASNVVDALELINHNNYHIIITDMKMPAQDGTVFLKHLERLGFEGHIIVLSAYTDFQYFKQALHSKVLDYILKPVDAGELSDTLLAACNDLEEQQLQKLPMDIEESEKNVNRYVSDIIQYLSIHYSENISLDDLAKHVFVTREHISRIFKMQTGINLFEYLSIMRIEKAKEFLSKTHSSLDEIAPKVGFGSGNYLSKVFKSIEGISPTDYRYKSRKE